MTQEEIRNIIQTKIAANRNESGITATELQQILLEMLRFSADSARQGEQGPRGVQGRTGDQGAEGSRGSDGLQGDIGQQGPQGSMGERGESGIDGEQGAQGRQGPKGEQGTFDEHSFNSFSANIINYINDQFPEFIEGPEGPKGDQGPRGYQGPAGGGSGGSGSQGPKGDKGDQGPRGYQGPAGGGSGGSGSQGPQGPAGGGSGSDEGTNLRLQKLESVVLTEKDIEEEDPNDETGVIVTGLTLAERLARLEDKFNDMVENCTITFIIKGYRLNARWREAKRYSYNLDEEGEYLPKYICTQSEYENYDPGSSHSIINYNPYSTTSAVTLETVTTSAHEGGRVSPVILIGTEMYYADENDTFAYKVKKGTEFSIKIFADGYEMFSNTYTPYQDARYTITLKQSMTPYLVIMPNRKDAETTIYVSDIDDPLNRTWAYVGDPALVVRGETIRWDYNGRVVVSSTEGGVKSFLAQPSKFRKVAGYATYIKHISTYVNDVTGYADFPQVVFSATVYQNIFLPVDLNGTSNLDLYNVEIGTLDPPRAQIYYHRAWHERLNQRTKWQGGPIPVYDGENIELTAESPYSETEPNYLDRGARMKISGNTTVSFQLTQYPLRMLKFGMSNVTGSVESNFYSPSAIAAGSYMGGWANGAEPKQDGYAKLVYPNGYSTGFYMYAEGYEPLWEEIYFGANTDKTVVNTNMKKLSGPYLNVYVVAGGYNEQQASADTQYSGRDGYKSLSIINDHEMELSLYCSYTAVYNPATRLLEMTRNTHSSINLEIYSSSQFNTAGNPWNAENTWLMEVRPKGGSGYLKKPYGFYHASIGVSFVLTSGVAEDGRVGDVVITNDDGITTTIHITSDYHRGV